MRLRNSRPCCMFHSDRGRQYCYCDVQKKVEAYGLRPLLSGQGNCDDNSTLEAILVAFSDNPQARAGQRRNLLCDSSHKTTFQGFPSY